MDTSPVQGAKLAIMATVGLSKDALHVYVGLVVFLLSCLMLRRRLMSLLPLLAVFAAAVIGELLDMRDDLASFGAWRWRNSLHDVVNTMFWPTVLWLLIRTGLVRSGPRT